MGGTAAPRGRDQEPPAALAAPPLTEGAEPAETGAETAGRLGMATLDAAVIACASKLGGGGAALKLGDAGGAALDDAATSCFFCPAAAGVGTDWAAVGLDDSFAGAAGATADFLAAGLEDPWGADRLLRSSLGLPP